MKIATANEGGIMKMPQCFLGGSANVTMMQKGRKRQFGKHFKLSSAIPW